MSDFTIWNLEKATNLKDQPKPRSPKFVFTLTYLTRSPHMGSWPDCERAVIVDKIVVSLADWVTCVTFLKEISQWKLRCMKEQAKQCFHFSLASLNAYHNEAMAG